MGALLLSIVQGAIAFLTLSVCDTLLTAQSILLVIQFRTGSLQQM